MTSLNDTSTHLPTAGDLNSTVVISEYARNQGSQKVSQDHPFISARSASFGDFDTPADYFDTNVNAALMEDGSLHRVNPLHGYDIDGSAEEATALLPGEFLDQRHYSRDARANPAFSRASAMAEMKQQKDSDRPWLDRQTLEKAATQSKRAATDSEGSSEESDSEEEEEESSGSEYTASEVEEEAAPQKAGRVENAESSSTESSSTETEQESGEEIEADEPVEVGSSEFSEESSHSSDESEEQMKDSKVPPQTPTVPATTAIPSAVQGLNKLKINDERRLPRPPPAAAVEKDRMASILPSPPPNAHEEGILNELALTEEFEEIEKLLQSVTSDLPSIKL